MVFRTDEEIAEMEAHYVALCDEGVEVTAAQLLSIEIRVAKAYRQGMEDARAPQATPARPWSNPTLSFTFGPEHIPSPWAKSHPC